MKKDNGHSLTPKAVKLIRLLTAWVLIVPSVCLGWAVLPASDNVWVAVFVTFSPAIPGWYFSGLIAHWYESYLGYQGLGRFLAVALLKNPTFREEFVRMWTLYVTDEEALMQLEDLTKTDSSKGAEEE